MNKLLTLLVTLVALLNGASAFTVARPMTSSRATEPMMPVTPQSVSTTARAMFIDPNIPEIASQPVGSIIMLVALVSLWEVITPGRAKK